MPPFSLPARCGVASCGGSSGSPPPLPVPPGADGGCSYATLAAIERGDLDDIRQLRNRGAIGNCEETQWRLYRAISDHDPRFVTMLLAAGVDPQAGLVHRHTCNLPLAQAFYMRDWRVDRDITILTLLLERGADPNADWRRLGCYLPVRDAWTALHTAVLTGDVEFARLLIAAGANVAQREPSVLGPSLSVAPRDVLSIDHARGDDQEHPAESAPDPGPVGQPHLNE